MSHTYLDNPPRRRKEPRANDTDPLSSPTVRTKATERKRPHITKTKFFHDLMKGVYGPRQGGARIIVDAENAATGVGKTGLATSLAQLLAKIFGYELQKEDFTLSGAEYLKRWREHPDADQPSVLVLDELSGAGAGDARRAMSHQNVNLGRSWQLMRKKRIVTIVTLPHWSDADKKMRRFADYRLWCREEPIGCFKPYKVGATFDTGDVQTHGYDDMQRIFFPNLAKHNSPFYEYVSSLKDDLLDSEVFDADELTEGEAEEEQKTPDEIKRETKIGVAQQMRNNGFSSREIAEQLDYSHNWVLSNTEEMNGEGSPAD